MTSTQHFFIDNNTQKVHSRYATSNTKPIKYTQQNISYSDTPFFFPERFEHIFLAIYFITLPYIAGLLFLFFYISNGDYNIFLSLNNTNSYILTWAIGYEILAAITLLTIAKNAIVFSLQSINKSTKKQFVIP